MSAEVISLLKVHEYFQGVADEALHEVVQHGRVTHYDVGSVVHEANVLLTTVGFVLRGRLKAVRVDAHGVESLFRMIGRGEQFGLVVAALSEPVPVRLIALEPTTVLSLDYERALELTFRLPDLRRAWLTAYAGSQRQLFFGARQRRAPMMLALLHLTPASRPTAGRLMARLGEVGEELAVFSNAEQWQTLPAVRFRQMYAEGQLLDVEAIRQQIAEWQDAERIIFDLPAELEPERLARLLTLVDRVVLFVPAKDAAALENLQKFAATARGWRDKISVAFILEGSQPVAPALPNLHDFAARDFKILDGAAAQPPWGKSVAAGLERLVHDLRGVRIGLALGGGAARGMSHLGVLKALEQHGIVVDMIAGTSAGAMTGILYASGLDPDYLAESFAADLTPSWLFRRLPRGEHWYLLYKYRRGHFDPMLRKYLHEQRLEQLALPGLSVTVDLVSGNSVVRERGDAVHAVLESINLPVLSAPICRNGQALVDGGLVNNIPADVLVSLGCNFVIAVSVTAKIEKQFCNITPEGRTPLARKPSVVQTILRSLLVQNHCMNAIGVQPADMVIEPDVTGFELTEFMRAKELSALGEAAARAQIPKIRQLLHRLDPQLFRPTIAATGGKTSENSGTAAQRDHPYARRS